MLIFTKTNSGGTDQVWFYDMQADGFSLDDKRTDQSFCVPKEEIAVNGYDLSINRYKEIVYEEVEYDPPQVILAELEQWENEIQTGMQELKQMLM